MNSEKKSKFADKYREFIVEQSDIEILDDGVPDPLGFRIIFRAKDKKTGKIVDIHQLIENEADDSIDFSKIFFHEIKYYVRVKSYIGIPAFYGYYFAPEKSFVTEHLPNESLVRFYSKLKSKNPNYCSRWNDTFKAQLTFGIACTMMHLHAFNVIHRYLTPDVIFFDDEFNPKITEFTTSKFQLENMFFRNTRHITNVFYKSPEVLNDNTFSSKSDVYSFGVILLSIVQGNEKFRVDKNNNSLLIPENTPALVSSIIRNCLNEDPKKRPSFAQIVKELKDYHPIFPETNEDDYRIYVSKYMQNVEVAVEDKQLQNICKQENENDQNTFSKLSKKVSKTELSNSAYSKSKKFLNDDENQNNSQKGLSQSNLSYASNSKSDKTQNENSNEVENENLQNNSQSQMNDSQLGSSKAKSSKKQQSYENENENIQIQSSKSKKQSSKLGSLFNTGSSKKPKSESNDNEQEYEDDADEERNESSKSKKKSSKLGSSSEVGSSKKTKSESDEDEQENEDDADEER